MSKFKVGDRVRISSATWGWGGVEPGSIGTILKTETRGGGRGYQVNVAGYERGWNAVEDDIELITEGGAPMARRTFKQLKESVTVKKSALWQEACDDGTQEYVLLDESFNKDSKNTQRIYDRALVENDKANFVEVFKVTPEYMTKPELEHWEAFKKGRQARVVTASKPRTESKTPTEVALPKATRPYAHVSDEVLKKFVSTWNTSRNVNSVARKMKVQRATVLMYRAAAINRGVTIKGMAELTPGRRKTIERAA